MTGYSSDIVLASFLLTPIILVAAGALILIAFSLRLFPSNWPKLISCLLTVCCCYGLAWLLVTGEALVLHPARLQQAFLGRQVGSPLALRQFEREGFMDPAYEWRYVLSASEVEQLRPRCRRDRWVQVDCILYSANDNRVIKTVWLEGNELQLSVVAY